ncbi:hypothetical protein NUW46_11160 [Marinobacter sp. MA]|uniref:RIFT barrel domain-containing protein n=1 Tax=Marinobacter sp. MA TaxID=2971606 RepID=UPI003AAC8C43
MARPNVVLREENGFPRQFDPVHTGMPLPEGYLRPGEDHGLQTSEGHPVEPFQSRPLSLWNDGSIRWLGIAFPARLAPWETREIELVAHNRSASPKNMPPPAPRLLACEQALSVRIERADASWRVLSFDLIDQDNKTCDVRMEETWVLIEEGALFSEYRTTGSFLSQAGEPYLRFFVTLQLYRIGQLVRIEAGLHNTRRALHRGGLWDLGDSGSVHFRSFSLSVRQPNVASYWINAGTDSATIAESARPLRLHQESSGGENWNSRNHVGADGKLTTRFRGYRLYRGEENAGHGERAMPVCGMLDSDTGTCATMRHFWQNFPSALEANTDALKVEFFPAIGSAYELQGGEQKQQTAWLQLDGEGDTLRNLHFPVIPVVPAEHYAIANAFPFFTPIHQRDRIDRLIELGLCPEAGFLQKREVIDEYGWRNFGDIFADHESLYLPSDEPRFISHYNNQYDAIYGFARQFALTGDKRWFQLMDDLARHVVDIDIYHTDEDRAEYNHGLFWHTDHYLDAHTATHRTYSRFNTTSSMPGQTGGGPAAEHCYTTGLLYHFWMTGSENSKSAVLELATWMRKAHEGSVGLLPQVLAIKKNDLPRLTKVLAGNLNGVYQYPFTRGTGNYINTLLDASLIQPEADWLSQAEHVIRCTIGPADNIEHRNLLDVETGWHYLVLLSAITRYLCLKLDSHSRDDVYEYALASLKHYWRWMVINEQPFLHKPEELEFPNHTWVAQDFRKVALLKQAALFDAENSEAYKRKAFEWLGEITRTLEVSEERFFTRVQIILLQNYGPHRYDIPIAEEAAAGKAALKKHRKHGRTVFTTRVLIQILQRLARGIVQFRPAREKAWLTLRLEG